MSQNYARLLSNQDEVEHFLSHVLELDFSTMKTIPYDIIEGEKGLVDLDIYAQTLNTTKYRDRAYKDDKIRWELRKQIIDELLKQTRPEDDDSIVLGNGGALPNSGLQTSKQAYILIGLPASGKSKIASNVSEKFNGLILNSDFAKRKLPEFANYIWGATIVHEESSQIVFGFKENPHKIDSVYDIALANGFNLVIPKIGQDPQGIMKLAESLNKLGYHTHLTLVSLLKKEATIRAIHRFYKTKRYVPLGLIFDGYGNDPCLCYHVIKNKAPHLFKSFGAISTNVSLDEPYLSIDLTEENPANLYEFKENVLI